MSVIAQYLFQAFLKSAFLGLVISLAWLGLSPIAFPIQEIVLYYLNATLFVWIPYATLTAVSQAAVTVSSTFVIAWIMDPMAAIHHRLPKARNDEDRAEIAEEGVERDWQSGIIGEDIRETLVKIEEDIESVRIGGDERGRGALHPTHSRRSRELSGLGDAFDEGYPVEPLEDDGVHLPPLNDEF